MKNLKQLSSYTSAVLGVFALAQTLDSGIVRIKGLNQKKEIHNIQAELEKIRTSIDLTNGELESVSTALGGLKDTGTKLITSDETSLTGNEILESTSNIKRELNDSFNNLEIAKEAIKNAEAKLETIIKDNPDTAISESLAKLKDMFSLASDRMDKVSAHAKEYIQSILPGSGNVGGSSFSSLIENSNVTSDNIDNLTNLTRLEYLAIGNFFCLFFILLSVISITNLYFGDYLINRFKLEYKHPILTKLLKYRSNIKNYSIAFNLLSIYAMLIFCMIVNFLNLVI